MYINKTCGCVLTESGDIKATAQIKGLLDVYTPETSKSALWKYWKATFDPKLCLECASRHGKIYVIDEILDIEPPLHPDCRCIIDRMDAVAAGGATKDGENAAFTDYVDKICSIFQKAQEQSILTVQFKYTDNEIENISDYMA